MNFQLPILSVGRGEPGTNKVCAEQAVNWLVSGRQRNVTKLVSGSSSVTDDPERIKRLAEMVGTR